MTELGENDDRRLRRRRMWRTAAYVGLLVAGILAAWQIHLFGQSRRQRGQSPPAPYEPDEVATTQPAGKLRLSDLATQPMAQAGLKLLKTDPGDLKPPTGATFRHAIQRVLDGCLHRHLKYWYTGSRDAAASHYTRTLKARGLELVRDAPPRGKPQERMLIFLSEREQITVRLGNPVPKRSIIPLSVTVMRLVR